MSPIWNRKRSEMIQLKNTRSYLLYALGEIILVVVGILIALQVNNWKEEQNLEAQEIEILKGIRKELLKDTIDLNLNIRTYKRRIKEDSVLLAHLSRGNELNQQVLNDLVGLTLRETTLISLQSYYQELKGEGIGLIQNQNLRDSISKFYDFDLKSLLEMENESIFLSQKNPMKEQIKAYFSYQDGRVLISDSAYRKLLKDKYLHYRLAELLILEKSALHGAYLDCQSSLYSLIRQIEKELRVRGHSVDNALLFEE